MGDVPVMSAEIMAVLADYPDAARERLLFLRQMIFNVAAETEGVGQLEETLKWGQISYLTSVTNSGSTIRIDSVKEDPQQVALFFHCQTTLVETFRALYGDQLTFEGNRCIKLNVRGDLPVEAIKHCITLALTYHQNKRNRSTARPLMGRTFAR